MLTPVGGDRPENCSKCTNLRLDTKMAYHTVSHAVVDLPEVAADFEQQPLRRFYQECSFVCMYMLASLEKGRAHIQILHEHDPCCYSAQYMHPEIKQYNAFISNLSAHEGAFQTVVTSGNIHQVNQRDKVIVALLIERLRRNGKVEQPDMAHVPFDLLQVQS